jgi:ATPase subunit of ABC transporter with duplicated ATPase domains
MSRLLIQLSNISTSFGPHSLFEDLSISIHEGDRFALIGENGSGKTTLLRLLAGLTSPDEGEVWRADSLTIGLLPQEVSVEGPQQTVRLYVEEGPFLQLEKEMEACLSSGRLTEWEPLHEEYERKGGYRRVPLEAAVQGLHLQGLLDLNLQQLSSGQRVRVALAKALLNAPDVLLLDEPTNHLDAVMVAWLQKVLSDRLGATIIVSHDRKFLNEACNRLIELEEGRLTCYGGSYDFYLQEREKLLERQIRAYEAQQEEKAKLKQTIKALSFSQPKPPPPSDRNRMAYDKRGECHQRSVQRTLNSLKERLEEIERDPIQHPRPKTIKGLVFQSPPLVSSVAIECDGIDKAYGDHVVFTNITRQLRKGARVIIRGPNGSGKTTLLRCIVGIEKPDRGSIRYASGVHIGYLDQEVELLPSQETPFQYFERVFHLTMTQLRSEMHKAAMPGVDLLNRPCSTLSVGQKKRLMILSLMLQQPNVLVLDEPTNHLDLLTLEALEKALLSFEGAILTVSHDPTFIEKVRTEEWKM